MRGDGFLAGSGTLGATARREAARPAVVFLRPICARGPAQRCRVFARLAGEGWALSTEAVQISLATGCVQGVAFRRDAGRQATAATSRRGPERPPSYTTPTWSRSMASATSAASAATPCSSSTRQSLADVMRGWVNHPETDAQTLADATRDAATVFITHSTRFRP